MAYLRFEFHRNSSSGLTKIWTVMSLGGVGLGTIQWFAQWRRYVLYPSAGTVWDKGCLREVADFCESETTAHART